MEMSGEQEWGRQFHCVSKWKCSGVITYFLCYWEINAIAFQWLLVRFCLCTVGIFACQLRETKNIFYVISVGREIISILYEVEVKEIPGLPSMLKINNLVHLAYCNTIWEEISESRGSHFKVVFFLGQLKVMIENTMVNNWVHCLSLMSIFKHMKMYPYSI